MPLHIHTPITAIEADRLAGIMLALEKSPGPAIKLTPLGVRQGRKVEATVIIHLPDGGREPLTTADARFLGRLLRAEGAYVEAGANADQLDKAADAAERSAGANVVQFGGGQTLFARPWFGGARG